jgi:hypothetical protein
MRTNLASAVVAITVAVALTAAGRAHAGWGRGCGVRARAVWERLAARLIRGELEGAGREVKCAKAGKGLPAHRSRPAGPWPTGLPESMGGCLPPPQSQPAGLGPGLSDLFTCGPPRRLDPGGAPMRPRRIASRLFRPPRVAGAS